MQRYLTAEIPGTGGAIKGSPEDFLVEEIAAYQPSGQGEHCYAQIEKRGIATLEALRRISKALGVQERDLGYAGMKDAVSYARQILEAGFACWGGAEFGAAVHHHHSLGDLGQ